MIKFIYSVLFLSFCVEAGRVETSLLETALTYKDSLEDDRERCLGALKGFHRVSGGYNRHDPGSNSKTELNVKAVTEMFDAQNKRADFFINDAASLVRKEISLEIFLQKRLTERLFFLADRSNKIAEGIRKNIETHKREAADLERVGEESIDSKNNLKKEFKGQKKEHSSLSLGNIETEAPALKEKASVFKQEDAGAFMSGILPTDENLLEFFENVGEYAQVEKDRVIRAHQTHELMILMAWQSLDKKQLSNETINLIKMSPHLCKILEGSKSLESSNPDHSGGFALLKFIYEALGREKVKKYGLDIYEERWLLACIRFSDPDPEQRLELERNGVLKGLTDFQRSVDGELFNLYIKDGDILESLPLPDLLKEKDLEKEEAAWLDHLKKSAVKKTKYRVGKKNTKGKKSSKYVEEREEEPELQGGIQALEEVATPALEGVAVGEEIERISEFEAGELESILKNEVESSAEIEFFYPACARVQPEILKREIKPGHLSITKKDQSFVNLLFDKSQLNSIRYADFERFWLSVGGTINIPGKGGSHRKLIAPDKTPLWGTFVPHGSGDYGPRSVASLRAAAWWLGLRPESME